MTGSATASHTCCKMTVCPSLTLTLSPLPHAHSLSSSSLGPSLTLSHSHCPPHTPLPSVQNEQEVEVLHGRYRVPVNQCHNGESRITPLALESRQCLALAAASRAAALIRCRYRMTMAFILDSSSSSSCSLHGPGVARAAMPVLPPARSSGQHPSPLRGCQDRHSI